MSHLPIFKNDWKNAKNYFPVQLFISKINAILKYHYEDCVPIFTDL
jgi:hypothetical protein